MFAKYQIILVIKKMYVIEIHENYVFKTDNASKSVVHVLFEELTCMAM
jgi:hypothetical protein